VSSVGVDVGGLNGYNNGGTATDSFWDTQTSGQSTSAGGTGKTTAEMQTLSTFTNWNITSVTQKADTYADHSYIWNIVDGSTYPFESWEYSESSSPTDTCTYSSGNWNMVASDFCNITSNVNMNGNNVSITGTGTITLTANITNYNNVLLKGTDSNNIAHVICQGGCFK